MANLKKFSKVISAVLIAIVILVILFILSFFVNHNILINHKLTWDFKDIIKNESGIEIIQWKSVYGKLNGNGNGINYFGTVLVKTDSEESINKILPALDEEYEIVGYVTQSGSKVNNKLVEKVNLEYDESLSEGEIYYSIYYFNSSNKYSYPFDLRGH